MGGGIWLAAKQTSPLLACVFVGLCDLVRLHWECDWTQRRGWGVVGWEKGICGFYKAN